MTNYENQTLSSNQFTRRHFLAGMSDLGIVAAMGGLSASGIASASGGSLNLLVYGGPILTVYNDVGDFLKKKNGYDAVTVSTAQSNASTVLAQLPRPKFDLFVDGSNVVPRYPTVYSEIAKGDVPNLGNVFPILLSQVGTLAVPTYFQSMAVVYNKKRFPTPPTLQDLTTPKFKGRWTLQGTPWLSLFAPLIMQYVGGGPRDPGPTFDWFAKAAPNLLTTYTQVTQPAQLFANDEIDVALWFTGRAAQVAATTALPIDWVRKPAVANIQAFGIPPGAANRAGALAFINRWLDPDVQAAAAKATFTSPVTSTADIPEEFARRLPVYGKDELANLTHPDWAVISPQLPDWEKEMVKILQTVGR